MYFVELFFDVLDIFPLLNKKQLKAALIVVMYESPPILIPVFINNLLIFVAYFGHPLKEATQIYRRSF